MEERGCASQPSRGVSTSTASSRGTALLATYNCWHQKDTSLTVSRCAAEQKYNLRDLFSHMLGEDSGYHATTTASEEKCCDFLVKLLSSQKTIMTKKRKSSDLLKNSTLPSSCVVLTSNQTYIYIHVQMIAPLLNHQMIGPFLTSPHLSLKSIEVHMRIL